MVGKLKEQFIANVSSMQPKRPLIRNCIKSFFVGGTICLFGEAVQSFYITFFDFNQKNVGNPTVATLILISVLLTGLGIYDKIGQFAGAGSLVPVTGFANSMTSAAIEHRSEGVVLGIATNMFKLAGSVIVFGVVSAYLVGIVRYTIQLLVR